MNLELMAEQFDDLDWASRVLRSSTDTSENVQRAKTMVKTLAEVGVTREIRVMAIDVLSGSNTVLV